jgi:hypothetical protein
MQSGAEYLMPRFKWISAHLTGSSYGDKVCSLGLLNFSWSHNNDTWNLALEILDSLHLDTKFDRFLHEKSKETYQLDKLDIFPPNLSGSVGHFCCQYNVSQPNFLNKYIKVQISRILWYTLLAAQDS